MPKLKKSSDFSVERQDQSGLSSFVERPMPTDREVNSFEKAIKKEVRHREMDDNLSEIYRDRRGDMVNVKKMTQKKSRFWRRLFGRLIILVIIAALGYAGYNYLFGGNGDISALVLNIDAPDKILAGQAFSYTISYHNPTKFALRSVHLELQYPAGFVFSGASTAPVVGNYGWDLPGLDPGGNGILTVNGQLISPPDSVNVISGRMSYVPDALSSQYTKDASASSIVSGPGFTIDLESNDTAFLNQPNDLNLIFSDIQNNNLGDFYLSFGLPAEANAGVATSSVSTSTAPVAKSAAKATTSAATTTGASATSSSLSGQKITITKAGGQSWLVSGLVPNMDRQEIPLYYIIKQKSASSTITVRLEKKMPDGESHTFWQKDITPTVVTSDLNLTLLLNGSQNQAAANFGDTLNYTLTYNNQGNNVFKDVVIMASLNGDFIDWNSVRSDNGGLSSHNAIIWTEQGLPALKEVDPGQSGQINFSVSLKNYQPSDLGKSLLAVAYGQYSVNNKSVAGDSNKSNTITATINSDLSLNEQLLYFNSDNIPVGSGPLPPKIGQTTSVRVYWTVKNSLHELSDTRVVLTLPAYVDWNNSAVAGTGNLYFDVASHQVIWEIGRLPLSVTRATADFSISLTPTAFDQGKILVLSPGATISAMDTETKATITYKTGAKTTKLEDDDIAGLNNSGVVQ